MAFAHKPGTGAIFKNDKKSKDIQPDYKGSLCLPDGSTVQIAGWISTKADGSKYLSLKTQTPLPAQSEDPT